MVKNNTSSKPYRRTCLHNGWMNLHHSTEWTPMNSRWLQKKKDYQHDFIGWECACKQKYSTLHEQISDGVFKKYEKTADRNMGRQMGRKMEKFCLMKKERIILLQKVIHKARITHLIFKQKLVNLHIYWTVLIIYTSLLCIPPNWNHIGRLCSTSHPFPFPVVSRLYQIELLFSHHFWFADKVKTEKRNLIMLL